MTPPNGDVSVATATAQPRGLPLDSTTWLLAASVVVVALLTLVPLSFVLTEAFRPAAGSAVAFDLANIAAVAKALAAQRVLLDTLLFSGGTALVAFVVGAALAWLSEQAPPPVRRVGFVLALVPLFVPGVLFTVAWMLLASPRIGLVNLAWRALAGGDAAIVDVYSLPGMIFVAGLHYSPLAFLIVAAALQSIDPALREAAQMSGAGTRRVALRVTLPLAWPAMLAALLLVFVRALESFEVPALIGLPAGIRVLSSALYEAAQGSSGQLGVASAYAMALLVPVALVMVLHRRLVGPADRYETLSGRSHAHSQVRSPTRHFATAALLAYLVIVAVLPLAALAWASLQPWQRAPTQEALAALSFDAYRRLLDAPSVGRAAANSLLLAVGSATLVVLLGMAVGYLTQRTRATGRHLLDVLATLPVAMPGLVIGVALMVAHLALPTGMYGTLWILLVAYLTRFLPYGVRYASAALMHLDRELEDAARLSGASRASTLARIVMPLIAPGLAAAWLYVFVMSARELSSSILLYGPGTEVLSVVLWELWENGQHPELAALGVVVVIVLAALVVPAETMMRRLASTRRR